MDEPRWKVGKRSVSQLQTYTKCSEAFRLEKVVRAPQRQAGWFIQGSAVHAALEAYERSGRAMNTLEVADSFEFYWENELEAAIKKQPDERMWMQGGRKKRETDLAQRQALGRQQSIDYVLANPIDGLWAPFELAPDEYSVEVGFEHDFDGVIVIGYIDCIEENRQTGEWRLVDWKTGTKTPADPFQMMTYRIAVYQIFGVMVTSSGWWMCKDGKFEEFDNTKFSYEEVSAWYNTMDKGVKAETFIANPGDGCFVCSVKPYCQYGSKNPIPWPQATPAGMDFS